MYEFNINFHNIFKDKEEKSNLEDRNNLEELLVLLLEYSNKYYFFELKDWYVSHKVTSNFSNYVIIEPNSFKLIYPKNLKWAQDYGLILKFAKRGRIFLMPKILTTSFLFDWLTITKLSLLSR